MNQLEPIEVTLTPLQMRAIAALLEGNSIENAAKLAGCSSMSVDRWIKLKQFQAALSQGKASAFNLAATKLGNAFILSVDVLQTLMLDPETSTGYRIKCCDLILQNSIRVAEIQDMNDRLTSLEVTLYEQ